MGCWDYLRVSWMLLVFIYARKLNVNLEIVLRRVVERDIVFLVETF